MSALELLKAARERIADPSRWAQRIFALNALGRSVRPWSNDACCWCALGALEASRLAPTPTPPAELEAKLALAGELPADCRGIECFNDDGATTHAMVVALFDRAIARLEAA